MYCCSYGLCPLPVPRMASATGRPQGKCCMELCYGGVGRSSATSLVELETHRFDLRHGLSWICKLPWKSAFAITIRRVGAELLRVFEQTPGIQPVFADLYAAGVCAVRGENLDSLLHKRVRKMAPLMILPLMSFQSLCEDFKRLPVSWQFALMRLWLGGLMTSHRLGLEARPCHWCSSLGDDNLVHLLKCPQFWNSILAKFCGDFRHADLSVHDLLGLTDRLGPSRFRILVVAVFAQNKAHNGVPPDQSLSAAFLLAQTGRPQRPKERSMV